MQAAIEGELIRSVGVRFGKALPGQLIEVSLAGDCGSMVRHWCGGHWLVEAYRIVVDLLLTAQRLRTEDRLRTIPAT